MKRGFFYRFLCLYWDGHQHFRTGVFTWTTIPHSPKTIGMIFTFQGLLTCWRARDGVPVLMSYYQRTKENPAGRRRRPFLYYSCTTRERKSSRPPATAVPVLKLYYPRTKIQPAAGNDRFSTKVVVPEDENPAGCRRRPFQNYSCTSRKRKSSQPPATAVRVLKLYYQRRKMRRPFSTKVILPERRQ